MSDSEEDSSSISKQKSIFSGMGRVKQINHLREKWSPKPKSPLPDRSFTDTPPSSPWSRRPSPVKYPSEAPSENGRHTFRRSQSVSGSPTRQPAVTIVDMERYLGINTWLERNGINVAQVDTSRATTPEQSKNYGLFDDMYSSLEVLEASLKTDLSRLGLDKSANQNSGGQCKEVATLSSPALFDYLTVIGADLLDVKICNYWSQRENVFEPTVAFAYPPESQFNAESLEHFCFPAGIQTTTSITSNEKPSETSESFKEGEFFVLMISGGGTQGQSIQFAMCMKGLVTIPSSTDDGKYRLLPICYCAIVQIPFISFFRALLQGLLDNLRNELGSSGDTDSSSTLSSIVTDKHAGLIDDILRRLQKISLPDKGFSMSVKVFPSPRSELILARPHKENALDEKVALLLQWALPLLLSRLSIDRLLQILSLLLLETKLIVVSDEIPLLSSSTLGLASLLHPLVWAGPLISVLPPSMHEYMEAPVPLICGVDELPRDFECSKGTCILYLADNRMQLHSDDEVAFRSILMPESENLSCDLTRFIKQTLGQETGALRDSVTPLSTHLVIHRVRKHIERLISSCTRTRDHALDASEMRFVDQLMQTQMYQKYRDDQPATPSVEQCKHQVPTLQPAQDEASKKESLLSNTQHDGLKSAACMLFQIALAGVSVQPQSSPQMNEIPDSIVDEETETLTVVDMVAPPAEDEPEPRSVTLSSPALTPSARISSSMKLSPNDKVESPSRGYELLSPIVSEASNHTERRPGRPFAWPLSHSELSIFWRSDETSAASPGRAQCVALHSPRSQSFGSPCRSPNNTSDVAYSEKPKCVGRSELGSVVKAQRADTETTISIFDTALSDALRSADDSWLFEPPDDPRPNLQHNYDSDDDRSTTHESSAEDDTVSVHEEDLIQEMGSQHNGPFVASRRSRHGSFYDIDLNEDLGLTNSILTADRVKVLMTGISVHSRGAWEGWCEGQMFVSPTLTTLTWERHAVAFAALNMHLADITSIAFEDQPTASPNGSRQRRVQFTFSNEAIYFQFPCSPQHTGFFDILKQTIQPTQDLSAGRQHSFPPLSSPGPQIPQTKILNDRRLVSTDSQDETLTTNLTPTPSFLAPTLSEIESFKRKLQRGYLVEKHGRLGRPHAKLLFSDALCSHIMWRKPPASNMTDQDKLDPIDERAHRRSTLFSQDKGIPVDSITAIVTGKQTSVFRRATANKSSERVCLSILTPTRTLDVCAYSLQGFQELYRGFSLLLEEIKRTRDGLD
ncbi:DENN (AEX-3) domain-containing protein [Phytophthora infestans]|uniref:DENN (AEX-3) domain-containing protein n=1 Tax=Phytophthora infestans TaxID=4787 RepID=A0A8S9UP56_PHYIN|nr:DENN (AEX-3) domain-containing protein [Phytophthora infestans]